MGQKIAVIGAGPMGLAVAYQLVKDGHQPVVFEADDRVGGMTATFDFNGLIIERYYHFHCISDNAFLEILKELGISKKMHWVETKMGYWFDNKIQPWGNPLALLKFKGLGLLAKLRYGLHAFFAIKRNNWQPLDEKQATLWLKSWVGNQAYEILWKKLIEYKFYHYSHTLSAAWVWSRIRRTGRSRYNLFKEKLGFLEGGSETLLVAMKEYIEKNGGEFRLDTPVRKVNITNLKVKGLNASDNTHAFDNIISTVPLTYIPDLIPDLPQEILKQFRAIDNIAVVCVIVKLKKSLSENFWLNVNDPDMDIPGLIEFTNLRPLNKHIIYVPFYMPEVHPTYAEPDKMFLDKVKKYLKMINPNLSNDDLIELRVNRYKYAQPVCPPKYLKKLPPVNLPVEGLFVADTSYYYPEDRGISESIGFGRNLAKKAVM